MLPPPHLIYTATYSVQITDCDNSAQEIADRVRGNAADPVCLGHSSQRCVPFPLMHFHFPNKGWLVKSAKKGQTGYENGSPDSP